MKAGHVKYVITVCDLDGRVLHQEAIVDVLPSVAAAWRSARGTDLGIKFKGCRIHVNKIKAQADPAPVVVPIFRDPGKLDSSRIPHGTYQLRPGSVYDTATRHSEGGLVPLDRIYVR